jgi:hypothetical protein
MIVILRPRDALFGHLVSRARTVLRSWLGDAGRDSQLIEASFFLSREDAPLRRFRGLFQALAAAEMFAARMVRSIIKEVVDFQTLIYPCTCDCKPICHSQV